MAKTANATRVDVLIAGEKYVLKADLPVEYVQSLAKDVDDRIDELLTRNARLPLHKAAILTAINLADELAKLQESYDSLVQLIEKDESA
ncbi:MAG: cell division protein ZapA [Eubacteriales bacterium]|nr:cell division protein ZapA [Bacillota bacterium]MBV1726509.1 cell division protein ZapA [Desulforudis sp.]MDP3051393.1 cell division protein ZapA [Eubacteriales bacterium]MDQ7789009.1 cell division protein ZapA [Clostridia bacterium]MBU4532036.1 cell division protein ZapA [Bacillota bacterium]